LSPAFPYDGEAGILPANNNEVLPAASHGRSCTVKGWKPSASSFLMQSLSVPMVDFLVRSDLSRSAGPIKNIKDIPPLWHCLGVVFVIAREKKNYYPSSFGDPEQREWGSRSTGTRSCLTPYIEAANLGEWHRVIRLSSPFRDNVAHRTSATGALHVTHGAGFDSNLFLRLKATTIC
jgi:hypothetical protein